MGWDISMHVFILILKRLIIDKFPPRYYNKHMFRESKAFCNCFYLQGAFGALIIVGFVFEIQSLILDERGERMRK